MTGRKATVTFTLCLLVAIMVGWAEAPEHPRTGAQQAAQTEKQSSAHTASLFGGAVSSVTSWRAQGVTADAPMDKPPVMEAAKVEREAVAPRYTAMPIAMLMVTPSPTPMPSPSPAQAEGYREDIPLSAALQDVLWTSCEEHGVPTSVALGVMYTESRFDETVVSKSGCYGLLQLSPRYFPSGLTSAENIAAGVGYVGELYDRYGDWGAALTAYNAGSDTGRRGYANAVLAAAEEWREP